MDRISYADSDEDSDMRVTSAASNVIVNAAPDVSTEDLKAQQYLPGATSLEISHNIPYQDLIRPLNGPSNPFQNQAKLQKNILTGYIEPHAMSDILFDNMHRTFTTHGYTVDVETGRTVGDTNRAREMQGEILKFRSRNQFSLILYSGVLINDKTPNAKKTKRKSAGKSSDVEGFKGPWAGYEGEEVGPTPTPVEVIEEEEPMDPELLAAIKRNDKEEGLGSEKSIFHGKNMTDYLGRTYMHVPTDLDVDLLGELGTKECYIPKKLIHTWTGHTKAVNAIRFFPKSAHLLLSASVDTKVKLWDVYHERKCLRTFMGHSKAVRDICFTNDGRKFLSASYDKYMKLWDTETGQCISSFTTKKIPFCIKFNPDEDKQNIFLAGCADKKVYQFDINSGEITQEYDQHLGAVNTITFVDDNRRFITTSDDKTLRAWEFDIPVVIKYVAEPSMHSMPAVTLHPNNKWMACQSLDNQIFIYSARDRFRMHRKKVFKGHLVAGYACQPNFSPDGRFVMSGDSSGNLWFWDWKTSRILRKFKAHDNVLIGCEWHPHETSKVATCSWDSTIK
ncbi:pre-mRNA-processing factor 17 [Nowakowskiella sp. JEL0078]|nr:pre-mRNA-processing factor 17 [Nowakowskiella sp. JEL0078]